MAVEFPISVTITLTKNECLAVRSVSDDDEDFALKLDDLLEAKFLQAEKAFQFFFDDTDFEEFLLQLEDYGSSDQTS